MKKNDLIKIPNKRILKTWFHFLIQSAIHSKQLPNLVICVVFVPFWSLWKIQHQKLKLGCTFQLKDETLPLVYSIRLYQPSHLGGTSSIPAAVCSFVIPITAMRRSPLEWFIKTDDNDDRSNRRCRTDFSIDYRYNYACRGSIIVEINCKNCLNDVHCQNCDVQK